MAPLDFFSLDYLVADLTDVTLADDTIPILTDNVNNGGQICR